MFSQLLDRKLVDFQNRTPSLSSAGEGRGRADNDDIKDDYIAAIRSHSPSKQQHNRLQVPDSSRVSFFFGIWTGGCDKSVVGLVKIAFSWREVVPNRCDQ
jgi:hypothetical protein